MSLQSDCIDPQPDGKRVSEAVLHGGKLIAIRVVWASELNRLNDAVGSAVVTWASLFKQNLEAPNRAIITEPPVVKIKEPKYKLPVRMIKPVDDLPVTDEEYRA